MAKKFRRMNCVYCLKYFEQLTTDHVFPKSWYPDNTPTDMEKWQVPACRSCNGRFGHIERELIERLALGMHPKDQAALGIPDRIIRAYLPSKAKSMRERRVRSNKLRKLMKEMQSPLGFPSNAIIPGYGLSPGASYEDQPALMVSQKHIEKLGEKIARGSIYYLHKTYIDQNHKIGTFLAEEQATQEFRGLISQYGEEHYRGPGVSLGIAIAPEDPQVAFWRIEFWQRFKMYVSSLPEENICSDAKG